MGEAFLNRSHPFFDIRHDLDILRFAVKRDGNKVEKEGKNGFTLLEVMVAVLLLAVSYVAVLESFSTSLARLAKDGPRRQALFAEELVFGRQLRFSNVPGQKSDEGDLYLMGSSLMVLELGSAGEQLQGLQLVAVEPQ
ncbi:MAG: type II secretion system protein [Thermodesulfobacteriota bacterium]